LQQGEISRGRAVAAIADRYKQFVDVFEKTACAAA
jgi:hypothetical protein